MKEASHDVSNRRFKSHELSMIVILSAIGGVASVPIGHLGNLLNAFPGMPLGSPQILSGLHVLWIVLASVLVDRMGAAFMTGVLKGLVEVTLFSFHSVFALMISAVEGVVADLTLAALGRGRKSSMYLAGGFSSASNVLVVQFLLRGLSPAVLAFMYLVSFASGLLLTWFVCPKVLEVVDVDKRLHF